MRVGVVAASARWMASSLATGGVEVAAADLFADRDLVEAADRVDRIDNYPDGFPAWLAELAPTLWLYGGGLENHPPLLAEMAAISPLAGTPPEALLAVRSLEPLAMAAREAGLGMPASLASSRGIPTDGSFLVKPQASAGGRGIRPWHGGRSPPRSIWQRRVTGEPHSVSLVIDHEGRCELLGVTGQFVGHPATHAGPFAYAGSVTLASQPAWADPFVRLGGILARRHGLLGAVGIDAVLDPAGRPWLIELNPRPTASMELLERQRGGPILCDHLAACGFVVPRPPASTPSPPIHHAKAILFAREPLRIDERAIAEIDCRRAAWREDDGGSEAIADLPPLGTAVQAGRPVVSVLAAGGTPADATARLLGRLGEIKAACLSRPVA
jgi:uncharacterized protein